MIQESFGEYEVTFTDGGFLTVTRHGQPWKDMTGNNMVLAMLQEVERLRGRQAEALRLLAQAHHEAASTFEVDHLVRQAIEVLRGAKLPDATPREPKLPERCEHGISKGCLCFKCAM